MNKVQLVITCEDCDAVAHFSAVKESEIEKYILEFKKKHQNCNPKYTSYFTISSIDFTLEAEQTS